MQSRGAFSIRVLVRALSGASFKTLIAGCATPIFCAGAVILKKCAEGCHIRLVCVLYKLKIMTEDLQGKSRLAEIIRGEKSLPSILYHYTSPEAFVDIVGHKNGVRLMCTNYRFLNDDAEFVDGVEMALRWMKDQGGGEKMLGRIRQTMDKTAEMADWVMMPWILSFSECEDSTAHWMAYTDRMKGGFAIGVDSELLLRRVVSANKRLKEMHHSQRAEPGPNVWAAHGGMFLSPCIYYKAGAKCPPDAFYQALEYVFSDRENFAHLRGVDIDEYATHCLRQVLRIAALLKRDDYEFEREWRVVFVPMIEKCDLFSGIRLVGGKARISLRKTLDAYGRRDILKKVIVAPHGNACTNEMLANLVKLTSGGAFKVIPSNSSYNGR